MSDHVPRLEYDALQRENLDLRAERDELKKALYAEWWKSFTPPTREELATAEPIVPWFSELISRLELSCEK